MKSLLTLLSFLFLIHSFSFSQETTDSTAAPKKSVITLFSGDEIIGTIMSDDGREILLVSDNIGKIYISKSNIKNISELKGDMKITVDGEYITEGPFTTRYSFTTNALPIKKNVNYAMLNLFGPEIHFALSNNFSLGVMSTWIGSPLALVGKYTFETKKEEVHFAIGGMMGTSGYFNQAKNYGGLGWGMVTIGNRLDNITISAGYGFLGNTQSSLNPFIGGPIASIAGIAKIGKKTSFIFDSMFSYNKKTVDQSTWDPYGNYILSSKVQENYTVMIMPGVRFQTTEKKAFQFSLAGVLSLRGSNSVSFPVPMCSWLYKL